MADVQRQAAHAHAFQRGEHQVNDFQVSANVGRAIQLGADFQRSRERMALSGTVCSTLPA